MHLIIKVTFQPAKSGAELMPGGREAFLDKLSKVIESILSLTPYALYVDEVRVKEEK